MTTKKTTKPLTYKPAGQPISFEIPAGTPLKRATNLPGNRFWVQPSRAMTPEARTYCNSPGIPVNAEEVGVNPFDKRKIDGAVYGLIAEIFPEDGERFEVIMHTLWKEQGSWSVNDSRYLSRDCDREKVAELAACRWDAFKANYFPRATVKGLKAEGEDDEILFEFSHASFLTVRRIPKTPEGWSEVEAGPVGD